MEKSRKKVAEATVSLPPTKAAKKDKRRVEKAPEDWASSKKHKIETEQVDQNKKKAKKLKKTLTESPGEKKDEGRSSDFEYVVAEDTVSLPPTKAVKKDKRRVEEAPEDRASSKKQKIETEQVDQNKKKAKKLKKTLNESPGENKDEGKSSDFEYGVAEDTVSLPPTKAVKKDKRRVEEAPEDRASSKKQKIETEQVDQNKKKAKKLKKTLNESPGENKDEGKSSDFEYGFAETPISIPPTKDAVKGKTGTKEATEQQASPKKQIVELEKVGLSKKMVKKLKKTLIECPGKNKDETWCSDFGVAKSGAPKIKPVSASKKKPVFNDGSSKSDSDEEVGGTGNKRMNSLPDNAKNNDASKIFEKEPVTPAKRNEESGTKRLFIGNLSSEVTKDDLFDLFKMSGDVLEIRLPATEDGSFMGFGHVEFVTEADARAALRMNGHIFLGRPLIIDLARERGSNNPHDGKEKGSYRIGAEDPGHNVFVKGFGKSLKDDQEAGNKGMDSLPDNAKNRDASKISEKEPATPAKRNEESGTKRVYVGNLPDEVTKDDLLDFFKMEVLEIRFAPNEEGGFRGFGHVEFATEADARAALKMNGYILLGCPVIIDLALEMGSNNHHDGKKKGSYKIGAEDPGQTVFVKGFGKSLKEDQIRNFLMEHFGSYGKILRISIPQDNKTGRSKGFAYILFNDQASVSKALELSGTELGGYTLTVQEPAPKSGSRDGSFSGGRGRGGRSAGRGGGHDNGGRERALGGRGPGASYNRSATTASKGKKTTFGYND